MFTLFYCTLSEMTTIKMINQSFCLGLNELTEALVCTIHYFVIQLRYNNGQHEPFVLIKGI